MYPADPRPHPMQALHSKIPSHTEILLTHGPPHTSSSPTNSLDTVTDGSHVGCLNLSYLLDKGFIRPRLHVFGHIHESRGVGVQVWSDGSGGETVFVNAAVMPAGQGRIDAVQDGVYFHFI